MYQILVRVIGRYAPVITFPIAVILGVIGYNLESIIVPKKPVEIEKGVTQVREDRLEYSENKEIYSKNIFDRNDAKDLKK